MTESQKTKLIFLAASAGKVLLVAGLVFALGWMLVQVAKWKNSEPTARKESVSITIVPPLLLSS